MPEQLESWLRDAQQRAAETRKALRSLALNSGAQKPPSKGNVDFAQSNQENDVYRALLAISPALGQSYIQANRDLADTHRVSWAGTAHEIREILSTLLRLKAPDSEVKAKSWFKQEPSTSGPTQKQRVRFILEQRGAGSKERELAEELTTLDEMIGNVVRAFYNRASDAAHRHKDKREAVRLMRYFDAFARDLLDVD